MKAEKITIKFKNGWISCVGNASNEHTWLACQKLNLNEVEPTAAMKAKRSLKRFFKALRFALSSEGEPARKDFTSRKVVEFECRE